MLAGVLGSLSKVPLLMSTSPRRLLPSFSSDSDETPSLGTTGPFNCVSTWDTDCGPSSSDQQIPAYTPQLFVLTWFIFSCVCARRPSTQKEQREHVAGSKGPGLKVGSTQVMKRTYWTSRDQTLLIFQSTFKVIASLFENQRVMYFLRENKGTFINVNGFSHHGRTCTFGYLQMQFSAGELTNSNDIRSFRRSCGPER